MIAFCMNKVSSLLQKFVNCRNKKFYYLMPCHTICSIQQKQKQPNLKLKTRRQTTFRVLPSASAHPDKAYPFQFKFLKAFYDCIFVWCIWQTNAIDSHFFLHQMPASFNYLQILTTGCHGAKLSPPCLACSSLSTSQCYTSLSLTLFPSIFLSITLCSFLSLFLCTFSPFLLSLCACVHKSLTSTVFAFLL